MSIAPVPHETTIHVRDHCLCLHANQAARALARRFDRAFRPVGLTSGQFSLLLALNRPAAPTIGEVARTLAMDRTTLTANLKPLERRALVKVLPDPADRRGRRVALTEPGMAKLREAVPVWETLHAEMESRLPGAADDVRASLRALI